MHPNLQFTMIRTTTVEFQEALTQTGLGFAKGTRAVNSSISAIRSIVALGQLLFVIVNILLFVPSIVPYMLQPLHWIQKLVAVKSLAIQLAIRMDYYMILLVSGLLLFYFLRPKIIGIFNL